jgi:hypothetical protein
VPQQVALQARLLDVAASPYDLSSFGVAPVPIECEAGRSEYQAGQRELMARAQPVRAELLRAYDDFIDAAFDTAVVDDALTQPNGVHFATATPGVRTRARRTHAQRRARRQGHARTPRASSHTLLLNVLGSTQAPLTFAFVARRS